MDDTKKRRDASTQQENTTIRHNHSKLVTLFTINMAFNSEAAVWNCWLRKMKSTYTESMKTVKVEALQKRAYRLHQESNASTEISFIIWGCITRNVGCKTSKYNYSTLFGTCVFIQNAAWEEFRGQ